MFFSKHSHRTNGELTETGTIWKVIIPSLAAEKLESIEQSGQEDGRSGFLALDKKGLMAALRLRLTKEKLQNRALYRTLQRKIKVLEKKLKQLCERIGHLHEMIEEQRPKVRLGEALIYTAAAIIYIMGDLVFSHQLILKNFGLGRSEPYVWIPLVLAIGLTPVFGKLVYTRFIESKYEEGAEAQPSVVKWFFLITATLAFFSFLYFGYVRGVGFKYQLLATDQDIYESLYLAHPYLNTSAFIAIAFLFLLGGSVLLAVGFKELKKWSLLRAMIRELRTLEKRHATMESHLDQLLEKSDALEYLNTALNDPKAFNETVESQAEIYHGLYTAEYGKGMKEMLTISEGENSLDGNFHLIVRRALQQMAVNGAVMGGHQNGH